MKIHGGVYYSEDGLSTALRGMNTQTKLFGLIQENIIGYNKIGYQNKEIVLPSFAEVIGSNAISEIKDQEPGRITKTEKALDFAISGKGFFQFLTPQGIQTSRDGRFSMDKDGYLRTLENYKVLSDSGEAVKFKRIPEALEDIKLTSKGELLVLNRQTKELEHAANIGIASEDGSPVKSPDIKQGFLEASNVSLQSEFMKLIPIRRGFAANRQMFIIQNNLLSQTIQQLSR